MTGVDEGGVASVDAGEPWEDRSRDGVVAGLRVEAERALSCCREGEPIAGRLTVRAVGSRPPAGGFVEPPGERGTAWLRLDGRLLLLAGKEWGPRVRRLVPYASWLQGLPLLHAAAVEAGGAAWALVGGSGAGKSTLAELLLGHGHRFLCDDLTPCRRRGDGYVVPSSSREATRLGVLVFVARERRSRPAAEALRPAAAVSRLARHGWGDLALADLWREQFGFYADLAGRVSALRLSMPDDRSRLAESAAVAAELLRKL